MTFNMSDDLYKLRIAREAFRAPRPGVASGGAPAFVGVVTSTGADLGVGKFFAATPEALTGAEVEAGGCTLTDRPGSVLVYAVGPSPPMTGDHLICRSVDYRWVAERTGTTGSGCPVMITVQTYCGIPVPTAWVITNTDTGTAVATGSSSGTIYLPSGNYQVVATFDGPGYVEPPCPMVLYDAQGPCLPPTFEPSYTESFVVTCRGPTIRAHPDPGHADVLSACSRSSRPSRPTAAPTAPPGKSTIDPNCFRVPRRRWSSRPRTRSRPRPRSATRAASPRPGGPYYEVRVDGLQPGVEITIDFQICVYFSGFGGPFNPCDKQGQICKCFCGSITFTPDPCLPANC